MTWISSGFCLDKNIYGHFFTNAKHYTPSVLLKKKTSDLHPILHQKSPSVESTALDVITLTFVTASLLLRVLCSFLNVAFSISLAQIQVTPYNTDGAEPQ
ncbi:hypothetical protein QQF64_004791 [Cirrhinus molitorella]|uniref:Uncharacterized protein n=1 Tax=Cirrhinus molitorella TaxID=172907 RepID=A0ABR3MJF7_9TELE